MSTAAPEMTEAQLAAWLHEQHVALDAGLLAEWQIQYLDERMPKWKSPETRATVA